MTCFTVRRAVAAASMLALLLLAARDESYAQREDGDLETVRGTVKRLTTAPKGEVDGLELNDGTVVHWPPHMERRFTAIVGKGDRVRVVGWDEIKPKGEKVLEVRSVTNLATREARSNDDAPPPREVRRADDLEQRL